MLKLGMFKFISVDTLIYADNLIKILDEGGWVEFEPSGIRLGYEGEQYDRDDLLLKIMEIVGEVDCEMTNFQPLAVGRLVCDIREAVETDFKIHLRWVIGESDEYHALATWLKAGNYFSIGSVPFSDVDVRADVVEDFLDKYLNAVKGSDGKVIETSSEDGEELLTNFFDFCRKSIVSS